MPFRRAPLACAIAQAFFLALLVARPAHAGMNRFYFAAQNDFSNKRGFYVDLENDSQGGARCPLSTLHLIFGAADGKTWRFLNTTPHWEYDHTYTVRATIGAHGATLYRDGVQLQQDTAASLAPFDQRLTAGERPGWANEPADYLVQQLSLRLTVNGAATTVPFPPLRPLPVYLFEPQARAGNDHFHVPPGAAMTIEVTFRLMPNPANLQAISPVIDRYGQSVAASWPDKIRSDADLQRAAAIEAKRNAAWGKPAGYDPFGGYSAARWHEKATGYFRTARHDGRWWLISPDGNPTFYTGLCTSPALAWEKTPVTGREYLFAALPPHDGPNGAFLWGKGVWGDGNVDYAALHSMNLIRKYGATDWREKAKQSLDQRLTAWGFSGQGKWSDERVGHQPVIEVLNRNGVPVLTRHPDIFDPAVRAALTQTLRQQITPRRYDHRLLGWSLGNEYDEIISKAEITDLLQKHPDSPAARALKAAVPNGDVETMRRHFANAYYDFLYRTVKAIDPSHLYFGFWISIGWWENEEDWRMIAAHCDVVGYDRYADSFADASFARLIHEANKPILCGEFSFPVWYDGARGFGLYDAAWAHTEAEAGSKYAHWVADAATNDCCVGTLWFQYRDEPITGRGPGQGAELTLGEHYAFGLVDDTDRPKWDLVTRVRAANLAAVHQRLAAKR